MIEIERREGNVDFDKKREGEEEGRIKQSFVSFPLFLTVILVEEVVEDLPPNHILGLSTQSNILRKPKLILPINNFPIRIMRILRTERRISNQTFKHDGSQRPPITFLTITLLEENFRSDVIRCTNCRISLRRTHTSLSASFQGESREKSKLLLISFDSLSK